MKKTIYLLSSLAIVLIFIFSLIFLNKKEELFIYAFNVETEDIVIKDKFEVKKYIDLEQKLLLLSEKLSKENFEGKKIVLSEIKDENGSKIAYFDLRDSDEKDSWNAYFQGSLGGFSTKLSIVETFLQRDFTGKWIDGIKISYNGSYQEFDHINFADEIYWRNNIKE